MGSAGSGGSGEWKGVLSTLADEISSGMAAPSQVIPTPPHLLDRVSPISSPFFPVFGAFSPSRRGGSNEPQAKTQGRETVARAPKHRFGGRANSGMAAPSQDQGKVDEPQPSEEGGGLSRIRGMGTKV